MSAYILKRIIAIIPITFGVMLFTFLIFNVVGGNPVYNIIGKNASPEQVAAFARRLGFDKPLIFNVHAVRTNAVKYAYARQHYTVTNNASPSPRDIQHAALQLEYSDVSNILLQGSVELGKTTRYNWRYIGKIFDSQFFNHLISAVTFHWGKSLKTREPIGKMFLRGAGPSLAYMVPAFILSVYISISISLFVAYKRGTAADKVIVFLCVIGMSVPALVIIIIAQQFFAYQLRWFPIMGYESGISGIKYYILPALIYVITAIGGDIRFFRSVILDETRQDYVRTAKAKGLPDDIILFKHVLRNAMIPIITRLVIVLPFLFLGSLLLETFFGIPGLGGRLVQAIFNSDFPVIKAFVFFDSMLYIVFNLISDILYTVVDPRVRLAG